MNDDIKSSGAIVASVLAKAISLKKMRHPSGNLISLPLENASRIKKKIGSPTCRSQAKPAGGSPNFLLDAAFPAGGQETSPEGVTQHKGDHIMTTENKKKAKALFNISIRDQATGKRTYVTSIYPRITGNGYQFKMDGKYYDIFPTKASKEEEGA